MINSQNIKEVPPQATSFFYVPTLAIRSILIYWSQITPMIFLLLVLVVFNVLLLIIFRLYKSYKVDTFQAIVFNYLTCVTVGSIVLGKFPLSLASIDEKWFPYSIFLGILFISGFNILAKTVQSFGVTLSAIAQKMSLILTVGFTILFFNEGVNFLKIIGILSAVLAIILINVPEKGLDIDHTKFKKFWYLLILTFVLSGIIDLTIFYVEAMDYSSSADIGFVVALFGMAALLGSVVMIISWITGKMQFQWKNVVAGIALGIPNFFTIYLLLKLIDAGWEGSKIFPILNVSIILGSAILGLTLFKEKLSRLQWIGFLCGLACIIFIALSNQ